jgi:hypothetical protein
MSEDQTTGDFDVALQGYERPVLSVVGSIEELTLGTTGAVNDGDGQAISNPPV